MPVAASDIITRVRTQLVDTGVTQRWSDTELLRYLSDGQRTIAAAIPSAANKVSTIQLTTGTRQTIPADGQMLLGVIRNMGTNGTTPGRAVRIISREIIDAQNPYWHTDPANSITQNFLYDPSDPTDFFVYPPSNGQVHVEINYAVMPQELTQTSDPIVLNEIYRTALFDYVMFRAHQKDSDFAAGASVAAGYLQTFQLFLSSRMGGEAVENPNLQLTPFNPQAKGAAK